MEEMKKNDRWRKKNFCYMDEKKKLMLDGGKDKKNFDAR